MSFHCSFAVSLRGRSSHSPSEQRPLRELSVCPAWKEDVCAAASLRPRPRLCPSTLLAVPGPRPPLAGWSPQTSLVVLALDARRRPGRVCRGACVCGRKHGRERLCLLGPPCILGLTDLCVLVIPGPLPSSFMASVSLDEEVGAAPSKALPLGFRLLPHLTVCSGTFLLWAVWKGAPSERFSGGHGVLGPQGMVNRVFQRLLSPLSFLH